jgi:hypothetical protein
LCFCNRLQCQRNDHGKRENERPVRFHGTHSGLPESFVQPNAMRSIPGVSYSVPFLSSAVSLSMQA